ncbi:MAG: DJ-1/PfpI family protein [Congregibacter sp.]|nr:DJ-1/PfpI family protein [Congregibacter sp.]MDP5070477.1 DJ-1/PfpI family protein [Congregibacter sp.]
MKVAMVIFDGVTQLDATAPMEVFAAAGLSVFTVAPRRELVTAGCGLKIMPDFDCQSAPVADILCVAGGAGVNPLLTDPGTLEYLRRTAAAARYITSVCTGALLLGAAGLLVGKRATTHWASHALLEELGAVPVQERVVIDGNIITGGGVTAGIDFALSVVKEALGYKAAEFVMLALEYDPAPPFAGGTPQSTSADVLGRYHEVARASLEQRKKQVAIAATRLLEHLAGEPG